MKESEEKLVKKAQKGETEAFGQLYDNHIEPIYRFVYLKVGQKADAEDIAQQVFINAWQNINHYEPRGFPFSSWLYKIAHNTVIDYYRTRKNYSDIDIETIAETSLDAPISRMADQIDQQLDLIEIKRAIKMLPAEYQTVVIMKFVEDLPNKEIAKILGKTEGALRVVQHRALKQLKKQLSNGQGNSSKIKEA